MPQRVIHHTNRTPASSSLANFKVQLASRIKRSIFATLVLIQRATTDTKFSKGTWHHKPQYKIRGKADGTAPSQEDATRRHYILPKSSSPSAGVGPGDVDWRRPHTPKANRNPMPQRVRPQENSVGWNGLNKLTTSSLALSKNSASVLSFVGGVPTYLGPAVEAERDHPLSVDSTAFSENNIRRDLLGKNTRCIT